MKWIILCLLPFQVFADVTIHTVSVHTKSEGMNNINPGVAYDFDHVRLGVLINSYKQPAIYTVGIANITDRFRVGTGVISGYRYVNGNIKRDDDHLVPFAAAEYDLSKAWSIAWLGQVFNLEYKF